MASSNGSSRTAPKGRATRARNADESSSFFGPTMQWIVVVIAIAAVLGAIMFAFRGASSPVGGGASGTPTPVVSDADSPIDT